MRNEKTLPQNIDEYIAGFSVEIQEILERVRKSIRDAAPLAQETIKYGIPTFTLEGNLVHFGGYAKHIGFYPLPSGIENFKEDLARYNLSKGTVQFPLDQTIPYDLIHRITAFRVQENLAKAEAKKKKIK